MEIKVFFNSNGIRDDFSGKGFQALQNRHPELEIIFFGDIPPKKN